eukprot:TRINITY_DN17512_c0_g1_i1.p1 TRINITY_DN17512_c0_g1~~TRINITY_DN17512_c0_g1_i1.p1  ORF type:complete len:543 (+),score=167.70 TRINITY_DN17512_c0_g1_i1:16-1644(+)
MSGEGNNAALVRGIFPAAVGDVPAEYRLPQFVEQREYVVNGELKKWDGPQQDIVSPICVGDKPTVIGSVPLLDAQTAVVALDAAVAAWDQGHGMWPTLSVADRIKYMTNFVNTIKHQRDRVVNLLMWEIGKNLDDSQKEFDRTVQYIIGTIEALKDLDRSSSRFQIEQGIIGQIRRAPLGVVLCMAPFNYPFNELYTTLIPALLMGNCVVLKPAKFGVLVHQPLLEAYAKCFPPGVLNTVYGDGSVVVGPLMQSGKVDCLAFIGSCRVADILKKQHPRPHRLRCVLGLGAKNPGIILPDADIPTAVSECLLGALSFNGQRCTAIKIIFVHRSMQAEFERQFSAAVEKLQPGLPWTAGVSLTPLPEPNKADWMADFVKDAVSKGARVLNPSGGLTNKTFYFPAVLSGVQSGMNIYLEEQFGPIVPIVTYDNISEPIKYMFESNLGQQVSIFGRDTEQLSCLVDALVNQTCRVNINCQCQRGPDTFPFTARKDSAEGTLSVSDALRVFSIRTLVAAKATDLNKGILSDITRTRSSKFLSTDYIF